MKIRAYSKEDLPHVIALWKETNLIKDQNNPEKDINRKMLVNPELFLVGELGNKIVGTIMGGYEGHRGWVNYLAVSPSHQRKGYARLLMSAVEKMIKQKGCPKINLQVRASNGEAIGFYKAIGYADDSVISLGKRLEHD